MCVSHTDIVIGSMTSICVKQVSIGWLSSVLNDVIIIIIIIIFIINIIIIIIIIIIIMSSKNKF